MKTLVKTLLLISVCLFVTNKLDAQIYEPKPGLDMYIGTWEWTSGSDKFQIVLIKQKHLRSNVMRKGKRVSYYTDDVVGWHSYTQAGKLIESSMNKVNTKSTTWREADDNSTIMGGITAENIIRLYFDDITKKKKGIVWLTMPAGKTNELTWKLEDIKEDRIIFEGEPSPIIVKGFSVPTELILKKVK